MLRALALASLGVILFPREPCALPFAKDVLDEVLAQGGVHLSGLGSVRIRFGGGRGGEVEEGFDGKVVQGKPDWGAPVIFVGSIEGVLCAEAADAVLGPEFGGGGDEREDGAEVGAVWGHEACEEGEDGDVALVADVNAFFVVVNGGVTVRLVFGAPVQIVDVADDGSFVALEFERVRGFVDCFGDSAHRPSHHAHPADQVRVELTWMRRLRPWVVVQAGSQNVSFGAASPSVGFFGGKGFAVIGIDVTPLGSAKPEIVPFQERIERF